MLLKTHSFKHSNKAYTGYHGNAVQNKRELLNACKDTRYTVCNTDNYPLEMIFTDDIFYIRFFTFVVKIVMS